MDIKAEKIELIKNLLATDDEFLLRKVKDMLENRINDFWNELPQHTKDEIKRGMEQSGQGLLTPHDEVMRKYEKYL